MPKINVPLLMALRSQAAHHQYKRLLLMNVEASTTTNAQGMTVITIHSMCRTDRSKFSMTWGAGTAAAST
jgi:hypothetical protein